LRCAQALFALAAQAAVNTAVERERELKSEAEAGRNRQLIWDGLKQAANAGRDLTPPAGANRVTAGWLELAKLSSGNSRDPFALSRGLADWRARYPGHPGSTMIGPANTTGNEPSSNERIALLLPLSGKQQAAGVAVRDGFIAAALQGSLNSRNDIQVFDTNQAGALDAYQRAMQAGASIVVGPLLKEDVDALANTQQVGVMTLALNALSDALTPPALMFQFSLDPEEEARQVAQRASSEGLTCDPAGAQQ
jgi:outer membrane PBP1 activator LpoA protein